MRTLYLVRHAKSSWKHADLSDRERPLSRRGERDAPFMARRAAARCDSPDLLISSPAVRALSTARVFSEALGLATEAVRCDERIYEASVLDLLTVIRELPTTADRVFLFGHNPAMTELVVALTQTRIDNVPTCGVAEVSLDSDDWGETGQHAAELVDFDYPKRDADREG